MAHQCRPMTQNATSIELPETDEEVVEAVRALPARQRMVIVLTYFADMSEIVVAEELGISRGTVKSQLAKPAAR